MLKIEVYNVWCGVYVGDGQYEGGSDDDLELLVNDSFDTSRLEEYIKGELDSRYYLEFGCYPDEWSFKYTTTKVESTDITVNILFETKSESNNSYIHLPTFEVTVYKDMRLEQLKQFLLSIIETEWFERHGDYLNNDGLETKNEDLVEVNVGIKIGSRVITYSIKDKEVKSIINKYKNY